MANTALHIKRIQQEIKDFQTNPSDSFHAAPLKDELHIWHFTIKGPTETEFEGGIYHGKIELPFDYPFKPPALYFLTPSGRYEVNTKICLTITDYHPEHWNPGWTIKSMLKALISYFPEKESQTGVGALEYPVEERKKLALQSKKWVCPSCGPIINLVKETEEEKKAEEVPENNSESKNKVDIEEVSVEMAGQKREDENVNNDVELEERKSEDIEEEKIEIPQRKEIDIREQQQKRQSSLYQFFKEDMQKNIFEHDFQHLQTVLLQHLQYYEAKQSIKFQRNILNVESQPKEKENTEKIKEKPNSIENFNADLLEDVTFENEQKVQDSGEMSHKEVEKKQIKKQITIINILIALLLVGAVLIFFYL